MRVHSSDDRSWMPWTDPVLVQIAAQYPDRSTADVLIRWSLQRGFIPLVTSQNPAHQSSNLELVKQLGDWALSDSDMSTRASRRGRGRTAITPLGSVGLVCWGSRAVVRVTLARLPCKMCAVDAIGESEGVIFTAGKGTDISGAEVQRPW